MTEVLRSPSSSSLTNHTHLLISASASNSDSDKDGDASASARDEGLSLLALAVAALRKSLLLACRRSDDLVGGMDIGWPTDVRHVAHVTFDRFHGFLGLPIEFEPDVPRRPPSASTNVFGVSTDSMQCSYDSRGNSVPTILLLMQRRLYYQGGLRAEGIFRINGENSQEEYVRDQLNRGVVPDGVDVHCLAGLIKAWFRELPCGVLDSLTTEQVMQCQSEEDCTQLVRLLPAMESALLDWAINLMADVVQEEQYNKMNARNIAMVFAPNMTEMDDPLTALMYAVQVMNFLKTLIIKTLREREDSILEGASASPADPFDENGHRGSSQPCMGASGKDERDPDCDADGSFIVHQNHFLEENPLADDAENCYEPLNNNAKFESKGTEVSTQGDITNNMETVDDLKLVLQPDIPKIKTIHYDTNTRKGQRRVNGQSVIRVTTVIEKSRGTSIISHINSRVERVEAWR